MITTPLCTLLGIEHPILNASMAGTATGELAAAVSEAGGFGMIGGTHPERGVVAAGADPDRPLAHLASLRGGLHLRRSRIRRSWPASRWTRGWRRSTTRSPTRRPSSPLPTRPGPRLFVQVQTLKQAIRAARAGRRRHHRPGRRSGRTRRRHRDLRLAAGHRRCGRAGSRGRRRRHRGRPWPGRGAPARRAGRLDGHPVRGQPRVGRTVLGTGGGPRRDLRRHRPDARL